MTLGGLPFFERATDEEDIRRCSGFVVDAATLVDGVFLSAQQCWDEGAVWWEDPSAWAGELSAAENRWIDLVLDGTFLLHEAVVQADDNDAYLLSYRDLESGAWMPLWTVPPAYSFSMATRPDPANDTTRQPLPSEVATDAVIVAPLLDQRVHGRRRRWDRWALTFATNATSAACPRARRFEVQTGCVEPQPAR